MDRRESQATVACRRAASGRGARGLIAGAAVTAIAAASLLSSPRIARGGDNDPPTLKANQWKDAASGGDARALDRVIGEYGQRGLSETFRGLLVSSVASAANGDAARARLRAWREKDCEARDTWLWYRTLLAEYERDPAVVRGAAMSAHGPIARVGAIHALAAWADPEALDAMPVALAAIRATAGHDVERSLLVEAWARVVAGQPGRAGRPEFEAAVEALLPFLSDATIEPRTRLGVARGLGRALQSEKLSFDPRYWRALLARAEPSKNPEDDRYAAPTTTYFDLRATGDRIVYVLDASGSMGSTLSSAARQELRELVPAEKDGAARPEIAWRDVHTNMQAVAEFTKLSIRRLPKDASFCVLVFGSDAASLSATPGLVPATAGYVAAASRDLDGLARGSGLGGTNFHGGLRRAFLATLGGREVDSGRPGDPLAHFVRGPTTIFVLSDGSPTNDDWAVRGGQNFGETSVFTTTDGICDDIERLNLLQACEIHTVDFGRSARSDRGLLERLAREGGGRCRTIGDGSAILGPRHAERAAERDLDLDTVLAQFGLRTRPTDPPGDAAKLDLVRRHATEVKLLDDRATLASLLVARGDRAMAPILLDALSEASDRVAGHAERALSTLCKHSFGWSEGLRRHERVALRRNWTWFFAKGAAPGPNPAKDPAK